MFFVSVWSLASQAETYRILNHVHPDVDLIRCQGRLGSSTVNVYPPFGEEIVVELEDARIVVFGEGPSSLAFADIPKESWTSSDVIRSIEIFENLTPSGLMVDLVERPTSWTVYRGGIYLGTIFAVGACGVMSLRVLGRSTTDATTE